ncbi:MAG: glycosyltransferase family 4 protein [Steroidobacteraceae bacterium]|nr:glycosyltransferase family 4 protein [Steroidobacteraceae bacterium]
MSNHTTGSQTLQVGFVTTGLYFDPEQAQNQARFAALSRVSGGEIFAVVYNPDFLRYSLGNYTLRSLLLPSWLGGYGIVRSSVRALLYVLFVLGTALRIRLSGRRPYDVLVSSDPFKSGLLALMAGRILGIPFAVELNGNYTAAMKLDDGSTGSWYMRAKAQFADFIMPRVLKRAAAIKLLYEAQLGDLATPELLAKTHVFHNLVPLEPFRSQASEERYFILLGHPWLLKGVDLAIQAFLEVSERHPEYHLRVVGYCPNPEPFEKLAAGHPRIHLQPAGVPHSEAIGLINRSFALLLPSRTEGMGRVLLEAMAASKPVVGACVDGIPRVIRHEQNGLLFECGNAKDLARQLDRLMSDPEFARRLGENAKADVHTRLSPEAYQVAYVTFLGIAAGGVGTKRAA